MLSTSTLAPRYRWQLAPQPPDALLAAVRHPVLASALAGRGIVGAESARAFLAREVVDDNPFRLAGMAEAVARLRAAIRAGERVAVYGDFDADGVTATALLATTLRALGADVVTFLPHRTRDGYGVHVHALEDLVRHGVRLVVTVDCGVRAVAEIAAAAAFGLDVIITDHHAPAHALPDAVAVIDPKRLDDAYGDTGLAGVGIAFKLAQALLRASARADGRRSALAEEDLLDLVALGTVADVAPLVGENRSLVHRGILALRAARRIGIRALCEVAGLDPAALSARDLGYTLGPRLNAAGRMDDARLALDLLLATDPERARELATRLEGHNRTRRAATDVAVAEAQAALLGATDAPLLAWSSPTVEPGVVGLVAGDLARAHYRPAIVLRVDGAMARASLRSIPEFDIVAALDAAGDLLERWGGHAAAGGLTVQTGRIPELIDRLTGAAAGCLAGCDLRPALAIDASVAPDALSWDLHHHLERLAPFGEGNPEPRLCAVGALVRTVRTVGQDHLKLSLGGPDGGAFDAIAFRQADRQVHVGHRLDVVGRLVDDSWQGRSRLQLVVDDLAASDTG